MQATDGNFYGSTIEGANYVACGLGCGNIFRISSTGEFTTMHKFAGTDGNSPEGALLQGIDSNLYGTAALFGPSGNGTVFKMSLKGDFTTLVAFNGTNGSALSPAWRKPRAEPCLVLPSTGEIRPATLAVAPSSSSRWPANLPVSAISMKLTDPIPSHRWPPATETCTAWLATAAGTRVWTVAEQSIELPERPTDHHIQIHRDTHRPEPLHRHDPIHRR